MANVKVFADRQTDRQTDKRTGQKLYAPDLSIQGHKNSQMLYMFIDCPCKCHNQGLNRNIFQLCYFVICSMHYICIAIIKNKFYSEM
jgi:hypothetical protein